MNTPKTSKRGVKRTEKPTRKTTAKPTSEKKSDTKEVSARDKRKYIDYKIMKILTIIKRKV